MFSFWKNHVEKCTRSFPRCNVNRGKVTSWRLSLIACSAVYYHAGSSFEHWRFLWILKTHLQWFILTIFCTISYSKNRYFLTKNISWFNSIICKLSFKLVRHSQESPVYMYIPVYINCIILMRALRWWKCHRVPQERGNQKSINGFINNSGEVFLLNPV
jgi:hypothetical protein